MIYHAADRKYLMHTNGDAVAQSLEFKFLVDRAFAARQAGRPDVSGLFIRAAERLFVTTVPDLADAISAIASRKRAGAIVAESLAGRLSPASAAAVAVIWMLRGARKPALEGLTEAFGTNPAFQDALRRMCPRVAL